MVADSQSLELAGYLDFSLKPIVRKPLQQTDWARSKYLWMRIGYDHIFNVSNSSRGVVEDGAIVELRSR
jgi:hypothetical protein